MKIIFLDIDGVLCSQRSDTAYHGRPTPTDTTLWDKFDRCAIDLLKAAVEATGAHVVLSSTWRTTVNMPTLEYCLGVKILDATRADATPDEQRGLQIKDWLDAHPEVTRYAILDDDDGMLPSQTDKLCRTSKRNGFLLGHFDELLELLS